MLAKHLEKSNDESGFTLVELLVVILIIGILAAIAIPAFLNQRQRANDAAVESDVKNLATQIETALIADPNTDTLSWSSSNSQVTVGSEVVDVNLSDGVVIDSIVVNAGANTPAGNGYTITAHHENGAEYDGDGTAPDGHLVYNSETGGFN